MNKRTQLLKNALGANAYWQVNKHLARTIGLEPTILLAHLIDLVTNYEHMPEEFYQQYSRLKESLGFSRRQLDDSIKILKEKSLIEVELKGVPAKNHYSLNVDKILESMLDVQTSSSNLDELERQNMTNKYREKEKEKKNISSAVAGVHTFSSESQAAEHMVNSLANWEKLTSIWQTEESSAILKAIYKKYFLPLGKEEQEAILSMIQDFGSDVQYLKNTWIGKTFKEGLMDKESLQRDIQKRKEFNGPKQGKYKKPSFFGNE